MVSVAISGCGCVSAVAASCADALKNISTGGVNSRLLSSGYFPASFSAPCFPVEQIFPDICKVIGKSEAGGLNRTIQLALAAIDEALAGAGLTIKDLESRRVGIALGTTVGCTFHNEKYYINWKNGNEPESAPLHRYFSSNLAEAVQAVLGTKGPGIVITNACASGADAIGLAGKWIENDLCDIAIAGGADEISRIACHGFNSLMLVSEKNCTPFDVNRQGLNLGEAAGVFILERERHAVKRKRDIIGWLRGYGVAGDAYHPTAPHPDGRGLQSAIAAALNNAGVSTRDIAMINAHGTGTRANDLAETRALFEAGFDGEKTPVVSTKGVTGHTLGAAGGVEAVYTLLTLNRGEVTGTVGCCEPDPGLSCSVLKSGEHAGLSGRTGMSQSLAFGGSNAVLVIEGSGL